MSRQAGPCDRSDRTDRADREDRADLVVTSVCHFVWTRYAGWRAPRAWREMTAAASFRPNCRCTWPSTNATLFMP